MDEIIKMIIHACLLYVFINAGVISPARDKKYITIGSSNKNPHAKIILAIVDKYEDVSIKLII